MSDGISGYARVIARTRAKQQMSKPLFGPAYLKFGQCFILWGYCVQLGAILGARYSNNLDAFAHAFLGMSGPKGAASKFLADAAESIATQFHLASMSFPDYIGEYVARSGYKGTWREFLLKFGSQKVPVETAEEQAWTYTTDGAAVGVTLPQLAREMFDRTHVPVPDGEWATARAAGLDIPSEQDTMSYEDVEEAENALFLEYCKECCHDLYSSLSRDDAQ